MEPQAGAHRCGPVVLIAWACGVERLIAVPAAVTITLLAALNHRMRVLPAIEDVERRSYGTIAYGASISLLLWSVLARQPEPPWRPGCW